MMPDVQSRPDSSVRGPLWAQLDAGEDQGLALWKATLIASQAFSGI